MPRAKFLAALLITLGVLLDYVWWLTGMGVEKTSTVFAGQVLGTVIIIGVLMHRSPSR